MLPPPGQSQTCGSGICKEAAMNVAQHSDGHAQPFGSSTNTYGTLCVFMCVFDLLTSVLSGVMQPPPPASQRYNNTPSEPQVIRTQVMCSRLRLNSGVHGVSSGSGSYNNENVRINPNLQTSVLLAHANGQGQPGEERYPIGFAVCYLSCFAEDKLY